MNRRAFTSAIVYQLAAGKPRLQAGGPNDQVGMAYIGVGIRGLSLFKTFNALPGVRPVAVADAYDGRLARVKELAKVDTTREYRDIIGRKDVDAVVIATPDHLHHRMVLDCLAAGKDVYCEKPLTWSIPQGREIMQAAKKADRIVQVGSQRKTSPMTAKARELVQSGAIGKVHMVRMAEHRNSPDGAWVYEIPEDASPSTVDWKRFLGPAPQRKFDPAVFFRWRCWWEYSGGVATDLFVHMLSGLHEVMDVRAPLSAVSQGGLYKWTDGRTVPDVLNTVFEYPGFVADIEVNFCNSHVPHPAMFMGTEGTLVLSANRRGSTVTLYPEPAPRTAQRDVADTFAEPLRTRYFESKNYTAAGEPKSPMPAPKKEQVIQVEPTLSHFEMFIKSVRDRTPSCEDAAFGHYAAAGAHLANAAYRNNKRAKWDPASGAVSLG